MTPAYKFVMPPQLLETVPMPRPMPPPPPRNYDIGGKVRDPEPDEEGDLTDLMQYYQPQPPMFVPPMGTVNPVPSMFGGVTTPPAMNYTPPMAPALRAPNGYNPLYGSIIPNFNTVYPNPPVTVADVFPRPVSPPPPPRPALIEPMPMPRPMPPPPPRNYDIGGKIQMPEEPEPEGNAFFTI